jgi:single-stranded-DNA-specific exonuclease
LKLKVKQQGSDQIFEAIGFGMKEFFEPLSVNTACFMMAFHVEENNFQGRKSLQLRVKDIRFC